MFLFTFVPNQKGKIRAACSLKEKGIGTSSINRTSCQTVLTVHFNFCESIHESRIDDPYSLLFKEFCTLARPDPFFGINRNEISRPCSL